MSKNAGLYLIVLLTALWTWAALANTPIGSLPLRPASGVSTNDSLPYVNTSLDETDRVRLEDLVNLPAFQSQFLDMIPDQSSHAGECLTTNGVATAWATCGGGGGTVTDVTASAPIASSGGTTPNITCAVASGSQAGCLASADWTTFNGKQSALSFGNLSDVGTDGIVVTNGGGSVIGSGTSLAQHVADATHNGYLSSTDWNTFNTAGGGVTSISVATANGLAGSSSGGTTPALTLSTTITGLLKGNGTAISAASAGTDYEVPLTFSTGLTRTVNTVTVNTSQNIAKLSNLTTNGYVKTSGSDGTLGVQAVQIPLADGGTHADLSATGGTSQVLRQSSSGANVTVSQLAFSDISGTASTGQIPDLSATYLALVGGALTGEVTQTETRTTTSNTSDSEWLTTQTANPGSNSSTQFFGGNFISKSQAANNKTFNRITALIGSGSHNGTSTLTQGEGISGSFTNTSSATVTAAYGGSFNVINNNNGVATSAYGLISSVLNTGAGSITTGYGLYISTVDGTTKYGLYENAGANNYFADKVGINQTTPTHTLEINGSMALDGSTSGAVTFIASATTTPYTVTMPNSVGVSGNCLANNGLWVSCSGGGTTWTPNMTATFTAAGASTWSVPAGLLQKRVAVLVFSGGAGGGGGATGSGGGGAGCALLYQENYTVTPGTTVALFVGPGGAGGTTGVAGLPGTSSYFGSLVTGRSSGGSADGAAGSFVGTCGGGSSTNTGAVCFNQTTGLGAYDTHGQTFGLFNGGTGATAVGGGGAGAIAVGANGVASTSGGNGGAGVAISDLITGTPTTYCGGGGGGNASGTAGTGGAGGGGAGGNNANGTNGTVNLGGGGGGSGGVNTGGDGGRGGMTLWWME